MGNNNETLVEPLLKNGNVYKLKCEKCKSVSVQITDNDSPDCTCLECGGVCRALKLK